MNMRLYYTLHLFPMEQYETLQILDLVDFFSPMEQYEIFPILNLFIIIPHTIGYMQIAGSISIILTYIGTGGNILKGSLIPNVYTITHESLFRSLLQMVDTYMNTIYFPQIYTLFHVIQFSNQIGMIPYSSTPTVEILMTQSLSFTIQIGVLIQGFISHKIYLFAAFIPVGTPLGQIPLMIIQEIISYLSRTFSLGQRQAVNMITGHILVKVSVNFIWVAYLKGTSLFILVIPMFLLTLFQSQELLIAYLQAYIFCFITCITFKDIACNRKRLSFHFLWMDLRQVICTKLDISHIL